VGRPLSYADAVKLLKDPGSGIVRALDMLTSGALLLGAVVGAPDVLGWFDARAEFARLSRELVRRLPERTQGVGRYERVRRIEAAHSVLVVGAYFEVLSQRPLPIEFRSFELSRAEQIWVATGAVATEDRPLDILRAVLESVPPLPNPQWGYQRIRGELATYYQYLSTRLLRFFEGLAVWERARPADREAVARILESDIPSDALERYEDLLLRLASDFPEVRIWTELRQHSATQEYLHAGFSELQEALARVPNAMPPAAQLSVLSRAYQAILDRPVYDQRGLPDGLRMPTLRNAYVDPRFWVQPELDKVLEFYLADDAGNRDDLAKFVAVHLTTTDAVRAPLLVLGQPGAGKSVLTKILAARLPEHGFVPVRVPLREVPADADVQTQIEHAVRAATGEDTSWVQLARAAGGALPVVMLDGLDELMNATNAQESDYLHRVHEFQSREMELGRPVAVIVTSRTSVADRARRPDGSIVIELAPFNEPQIDRWLRVWNAENAAYFAAHNLVPLRADIVLRQPDLAGQPLLLLMLALYDAPENSLLRSDHQIGAAELYERLMMTFAEREVRKNNPDLPDYLVAENAQRELKRISVAAFAMFNRLRQSITEAELDTDLAALMPDGRGGDPPEGSSQANRTAVTPAQETVGRFFFVHEDKALAGDTELRAYEFLHATFGEFLIARLITNEVRQLVEKGMVPDSEAAITDDRLLHALTSFASLADSAPATDFVDGRLQTLREEDRTGAVTVLSRLFRRALDERPTPTLGGYRPMAVEVPARHAMHSINLLLLLVLASPEPVSVRRLLLPAPDPVAQWARHSTLWRSCLDDRSWDAVLSRLRGRRSREGPDPDVLIGREDGSPVSLLESTGLHLYSRPLDAAWSEGDWEPNNDVQLPPRSSGGRLLRTASLLLDYDRDVLLDALAPYLERYAGAGPDRIVGSNTTEARQTIAALLAQRPLPPPAPRRQSDDRTPAPPPPPPNR
jgi:hypothetical protein